MNEQHNQGCQPIPINDPTCTSKEDFQRRFLKLDPAETPPRDQVSPEEWIEAHERKMAFLRTAVREPIGGQYDGEYFRCDDLETLHANLLMLRDAGYRVPEYALDVVSEEMKGEA